MPSPPKPWERGATAAAAAPSITPAPAPPALSTPAAAATAASSSTIPTAPQLPASLQQASPYGVQSSYASPYSRPGMMGSAYSPYGSYGGMGSYGGIGSYGGMGSYGGYNSFYGGGMGGYGGMGMGGMGMPGMLGPNGLPMDQSLTSTLEATTQHTFALLHSIVQTFTGVSQMLESTFMATHSSFFAMVGVVDQFGQLRNALGSVLGLFGLVRWMKDMISGNPHGASTMQGEFRDFVNGKPVQGPNSPPPPKASKKPIIIFLLAIFGIPYAMSKLIQILNQRALAQNPQLALPPLDPSQLTFARALYPYTPSPSSTSELPLKENEIVAIMGKLDPVTGVEVDPRIETVGESEWWKGRTREGREGWFPRKWVEVLERREAKKID